MPTTRTRAVRDALLPELHPYYHEDFGGLLHHPLIIETISNCEAAARANERYQDRKKRERELRADPGDGLQYVWLHERAYRFGALRRIHRRLADAVYWELVAEVWIDTESVHQHFAGWQQLWSDPRPCKQQCMTPDERAALAGMPALISVWRGVGFRGRARGLSWTVDRDKAVWFAQRWRECFGGTGKLVHAEVERHRVHAFLLGREESEIIASDVRVLKMERLRSDPQGAKPASQQLDAGHE